MLASVVILFMHNLACLCVGCPFRGPLTPKFQDLQAQLPLHSGTYSNLHDVQKAHMDPNINLVMLTLKPVTPHITRVSLAHKNVSKALWTMLQLSLK